MTRIAVVSPQPIKGSGGIRTILNYAKALSDDGHDVTVSFLPEQSPVEGCAPGLIQMYYGIDGLAAKDFPGGLSDAEAVIATRWDTPSLIRRFYSGPLIHLVQDLEGWFNPVGDNFLLAENNFVVDSSFIALGHWLAKKIQKQYSAACYVMDFGHDCSIYWRSIPYAQRAKRISFIFQPEKPRRCSRLGIEALGIVNHYRPDYEIVFYGADTTIHLWYAITNIGIVSPEELHNLYNNSRAGLCISPSNPSRIPFEMMACGLPVVDLYRSNNLHDYTNALLLAHQTPESLAKAILEIINNETLGERLSNAGVNFSANRSNEEETRHFVQFVNNYISGRRPEFRTDFAPTYTEKPVISSSYNMARVLSFCKDQRREFDAEKDSTTTMWPDESGDYKFPCNIIFPDKVATVRQTSGIPENFKWETVSYLKDYSLQIHPVEGMPTSAVIPSALPKNVIGVVAIVNIANPQALSAQFAMALTAATGDADVTELPSESLWGSEHGSGWVEVKSGEDVTIRIDLNAATCCEMDLHVATRVPDGSSDAYCWCRWKSFFYLTADENR